MFCLNVVDTFGYFLTYCAKHLGQVGPPQLNDTIT